MKREKRPKQQWTTNILRLSNIRIDLVSLWFNRWSFKIKIFGFILSCDDDDMIPRNWLMMLLGEKAVVGDIYDSFVWEYDYDVINLPKYYPLLWFFRKWMVVCMMAGIYTRKMVCMYDGDSPSHTIAVSIIMKSIFWIPLFCGIDFWRPFLFPKYKEMHIHHKK